MHTTGADPTSVTCHVTIILFIRHLFEMEIKKKAAGRKNIQLLRHAITLGQEAEIKLKKDEGSNDDNRTVIRVSTIMYSEVMVVQEQSDLPKILKKIIKCKK